MARHDPNSQLEFVLHAVSRSLARTYNERFRALGLTQNEAGALLQVDWSGAHTQTEIAQRLGIGKAAAGALIIDLEREGLVMRQRSRDDGRMIDVSLTAAGRAKVKEINDFVQQLGPTVRANIAEADLQLAMDVLRQVRANLDEVAGDAPD